MTAPERRDPAEALREMVARIPRCPRPGCVSAADARTGFCYAHGPAPKSTGGAA